MRRVALILFAVALGATLVAPAAGATAPPTTTTTAAVPAAYTAFCRSADDLLRFIAHAPDPRKLDTARGRRVLRALRTDATPEVAEATATIASSFGYLGRHGRGTLSKARDSATSDAMFRMALVGASHCHSKRINELAQGFTMRRLAQADAARKAARKAARSGATTTTTVTP
jgi:hypothetical protein